ncbi:MAG: helix-turn-helix domain-containing protein [Gemmatimonadota bacterium]|nr:helix-turn-helix domain-containing protein [Gemmatimonadota bacterium]
MPRTRSIARLVRTARTSAGLSQRELARRARTVQSVVARVEAGTTSPTWDTLVRLLGAAGFEIDPVVRPRAATRSHMLADVSRILRLTPEARLTELRNASRFLASARRRE